MGQDIVPVFGYLRKELHFQIKSEVVGKSERERKNLDQSLPSSLGVQESKIDSSLVDQRAVSGVRQPGE